MTQNIYIYVVLLYVVLCRGKGIIRFWRRFHFHRLLKALKLGLFLFCRAHRFPRCIVNQDDLLKIDQDCPKALGSGWI